MKHLLSREDYIVEYLRVSRNIEQDDELNEGLLGALFGGFKMLFKKEWSNIKCKNPSVLPHLQDIDKSLGGYTMTKMQFSGECQTIRQNVANYFSDIIEFKLKQLEETGDPNKYLEKEKKEKEKLDKEKPDGQSVEEEIGIRDKTMLDTLKKYKENIKVACSKSPKLREWADQMLNSVEIFVNDIIIAELDKKGVEKEKLEKEKKELEEKKKKLDDIRKKMDEETKKAGEEVLKKLSKERDDAMRSLGVTPIGTMDGDKSVETIAKQFSDMIGEFNNMKLNEGNLPTGYEDILKSDTYVGVANSLKELDWDIEGDKENVLLDKFLMRVILNKINTVFDVVVKSKDMFKGVPSASVQAMMVALSNAIIYGFKGDEFKIEQNKERLSLITKCAIDSDATIGFNLPLIDPNKPENGNFFVSIMNQFKSSDISAKEVEDAMKTMSAKELKMIEKIYGENKEDDDKKEEEPSADSKGAQEFIKSFGPDIMKAFRQNMTKLFDMVVQNAKKLKEDAEKQREAEAQKAQQESEAAEKKKE